MLPSENEKVFEALEILPKPMPCKLVDQKKSSLHPKVIVGGIPIEFISPCTLE
jgi:hypothetical protein